VIDAGKGSVHRRGDRTASTPSVRTIQPAKFALVLAHFSLALLHIRIGSNLYMVVAFTCISLMGSRLLLRETIWASDFYIFGLAVYSATAALVVKAALLQPLQANLIHPFYSTTVLLAGFGAAAAGAWLARRVQRPGVDRCFLEKVWRGSRFSESYVPFLAVGTVFFILHVALRPRFTNGVLVAGEGFGGFGSLYFMLLFGITAALHAFGKGGDRLAQSAAALAFGLMLTLSLIANTKIEFAQFAMAVALTVLAFRLRVKILPVFVLALTLCIFVFYLSPIIHLMRNEFVGLSASERLHRAWEIAEENDFSAARLLDKEAQFLSGFSMLNREDRSFIFPTVANLERFFLVFPLDQVAREELQGHRMSAGPFLRQTAESVLPSILISKDAMVGADLVAWEYGIRSFGTIGRPVIGPYASLLAMGGIPAVALGMFVSVLLLYSLANFLFGHLRQSSFGTFFFVLSVMLPEKEIDAMYAFFLRDVVIVILFFLALAAASRRPRFRVGADTAQVRA